jgi:hypothetical protein
LSHLNVETSKRHLSNEFALLEEVEKSFSRPEITSEDAILIALGMAKFIQTSRDLNLEFFKDLNSQFQEMFRKMDEHIIQAFRVCEVANM